ncbi:MAG: hypothetical protein HKN09_04670, partial [Saprospiraceae bacterium]|nr:hypothetical protein [Saprospiraceae bacterium]
MTKYIASLFCLCIIIACSSKDNKASLVGKWHTAEWYIKNDNSPIPQKMTFEFDSTGRYIVDYGSEKEEGAYRLQYNT